MLQPGQDVVTHLADDARAQAARVLDAVGLQRERQRLKVPDGVGQDVDEATAADDRGGDVEAVGRRD